MFKAIGAAFRSFFGSRLAIGISGVLFVAFAGHSLTAPERLPPFGRVGLVELGIVAAPDLGQIPLPDLIPADIQADLRGRAQSAVIDNAPKAGQWIGAYLAARPDVVRWINYAATLGSFLLLLLTLQLQTATIKRHRKDVYAFVDGGFGT